MKGQHRNSVLFKYYPLIGLIMAENDQGYYTGEPQPAYAEPIVKRGNISTPSGGVVQTLSGLEQRYTHTLVMCTPKSGIKEDGVIVWRDEQYLVVSVMPSINSTLIALRKAVDGHPYVPIIREEDEVEEGEDEGDEE